MACNGEAWSRGALATTRAPPRQKVTRPCNRLCPGKWHSAGSKGSPHTLTFHESNRWCKDLYNTRTASMLTNHAAERRKRMQGAAQAPEQLEQI